MEQMKDLDVAIEWSAKLRSEKQKEKRPSAKVWVQVNELLIQEKRDLEKMAALEITQQIARVIFK